MTRAALLICLPMLTCVATVPAAAGPLATAGPLAGAPASRLGGEITSSDSALKRPPEPPPAANPLWAIPLSDLTETRERPPFAPTRRPPPIVVDARPRPPERLPPRTVPPEQPPLKLIGTIVGEAKGFGLFLDTSNKSEVRLSMGKSYRGWLLRTVRVRSVVMEKDHINQTLVLPTPPPLQPTTTARPPDPAAATESDAALQQRPRRAPIDAANAYR